MDGSDSISPSKMSYITFDDTTTAMLEPFESGYVLLTVTEPNAKEFSAYNYSVIARDCENAGFDLVAAEDWCGQIGDKAHLLDLGMRAMMVDIVTRKPVHYWLVPRSSIYKTGHMMANSVGVIDASYRGVLKAPVIRTSVGTGFKCGERYFQIVAPNMGEIVAVRAMRSLPESSRGEGGFGSTGQ